MRRLQLRTLGTLDVSAASGLVLLDGIVHVVADADNPKSLSPLLTVSTPIRTT